MCSSLRTDLRAHDATALYRRILSGGEAYVCPSEKHLPDRADFAGVWRRLGAAGGAFRGSLQTLPDFFDTEAEKACICLAVMDELGLLCATLTGDELHIEQNAGALKVDLGDSSSLRRLRGG